MLLGEAGARLDVARVSRRNRDRDARADRRTLSRLERDSLARREIEARVVGVGALREHRVGAQPANGELDQPSSRFRSASAIMNGAKRTRSRRGSRARMQDPLGCVLALFDRRSQAVQLCQPGTRVVGHEQPHLLEALAEVIRDPRAQLLEALAGQRGDLERVPEAARKATPGKRVEAVDLVQRQQHRQRRCADLVQHRVDRVQLLDEPLLRLRRIGHVHDEVGDERLLQRRGEAFDELMRQAADEADRVGDEVAPSVVLETARGRVERLEEAILDGDVRVGQRVEQRRLARVRVAGERDRRDRRALALLAPRAALARDLGEAALEDRDPAPREPAVGLELRLARAARPHAGAERAAAAAEPFEVLPGPAHARQVVLELCELDLELSLGADGVLGEDVEDQLRPVDDPRLERVLEVALLRRLELVVDDQRVGSELLERLLDLFDLALAHVRPHGRACAVLDDRSHGLDARGAGELLHLGELLRVVHAWNENRQNKPTLELRGRLRVRHAMIMPWSPTFA